MKRLAALVCSGNRIMNPESRNVSRRLPRAHNLRSACAGFRKSSRPDPSSGLGNAIQEYFFVFVSAR